MREGYRLFDTIILNGKIGYCATCDENYRTIGVQTIKKEKRLNGEVIDSIVNDFPFTKEMEYKCDWGNCYVSIQMLFGDTPIDLEHIDEVKIISMEGNVESEYYHHYSELTGYLWTDEGFKAGGHDIPKILESHNEEYIHMKIELYRKC